jgi:hypothetical protein
MEVVNLDLICAGTGHNLRPIQIISDPYGTNAEHGSFTPCYYPLFYGRVNGLKQIEFRGFLGALSQAASKKDNGNNENGSYKIRAIKMHHLPP